jgi:hypothetical protein
MNRRIRLKEFSLELPNGRKYSTKANGTLHLNISDLTVRITCTDIRWNYAENKRFISCLDFIAYSLNHFSISNFIASLL